MERNIETYYKEYNYPSSNKLYKIMKSEGQKVTLKEIKDFINNQTEKELYKKPTKTKGEGHIVAFQPNEFWQMDIFDMSQYYRKNKNYKYILCCIDVFTRKAFIYPMKNKNIESTTEALQEIIKKNGTPRYILSDNDKSFLGNQFQNLIDKYEIAHNTNILNDHKALGIVDRMALTLKTILNQMFIKNKNTNWIDHIDDVIRKYNNTPHNSLLDYKPNEVEKKEEEKNEIEELNIIKNEKNREIRKKKSLFNVGEPVRIKIDKTFKRGYEPNFSDKLYYIKNIDNKNITIDNNKTYKDNQLIKAVIQTNENPTKLIKQTKKNYQNQIQQKKESIDEQNIRTSKRAIKKKIILDL